MSLQPFNVPQLQDNGLGAAASLLGNMTNAQTSLINAKKERRKDILATLIGGSANIGNQLLENKQRDQTNDVNLEIAKQKQPSRFLQQANSYAALAKAAGDAGNFAQQEQFNKLALSLGEGAMGGGGSLIGGSGANFSPNLSGGTIPAESSTIPSSDTGTNAKTDYGMKTDSSNGIAKGINISTQKAIGDTQEAVQKGSVAKNKLNIAKGYESLQDTPSGSKFSGLGGLSFKGVKMTPEIQSIIAQEKQGFQIDPVKFNNEKRDLSAKLPNIVQLVTAVDTIKKRVNTNPQAGGLASSLGAKIRTEEEKLAKGALGGFLPQEDKGALAAQSFISSRLPNLRAPGDVGALSNQDIQSLKEQIPQFTQDRQRFNQQYNLFVGNMLRPVMKRALVLGDDASFNELQKLHVQSFGTAYDGLNTVPAKVDKSGNIALSGETTSKPSTGKPAITSKNNQELGKIIGF